MAEAAKSVAIARERFLTLGAAAKIRHVAIESGHDYNAPMREAMYGWVEKWLCGRGDGEPIKEPEFQVESIDSLRCYRDGRSRPKTIVTIPEFVRMEGTARLAALPKPPDHKEHWNAEVERVRFGLRNQVLGGFPPRTPLEIKSAVRNGSVCYRITTETGIESTGVAMFPPGGSGTAGTVIVATPGGKTQPGDCPGGTELSQRWLKTGFAVLAVTDARFTPLEVTNVAPVAGVADHNVAEWGLWVNRPLLGQWTWDLIRWLDFLEEMGRAPGGPGEKAWKPARPYVIFGYGGMSLPSLVAVCLTGADGVYCDGCLISYVPRAGRAWSGHPMGLLAPGMLELVDVGQLAGLMAPRPLAVVNRVEPDGEAATPERIGAAFDYTRRTTACFGPSIG